MKPVCNIMKAVMTWTQQWKVTIERIWLIVDEGQYCVVKWWKKPVATKEENERPNESVFYYNWPAEICEESQWRRKIQPNYSPILKMMTDSTNDDQWLADGQWTTDWLKKYNGSDWLLKRRRHDNDYAWLVLHYNYIIIIIMKIRWY